jgi:hypothetical protein
MPQPADPREQRQATPDPLSDSIVDMRARAGRFHEESKRLEAEQAAQEQHQRDRQARHEAAARKIDEETRAALLLRFMKMQEATKPPAEVPPVPFSTARQDETLEAEQAAGRRALAKYARRSEAVAATEDTTSALSGFKP